MLEVDIDRNIEKIDEIIQESNGIKKAIRRKKQKHQHDPELFSRPNELNKSKTELKKTRSIKTKNFAHQRSKAAS